jgi:hypothetical protein
MLDIDEEGNRYWYNSEGKLHRDNGPAVEWNDGAKEWLINGERHRIDGPAYENNNGDKAWYIEV